LEHPDNALKFIKNFHSDLVSTAEMMSSSIVNSLFSVDLLNIATKSIERLIYFFKAKDMNSTKNELVGGGKFFKYLCIEDAKNGYKFFKTTKNFVLSCLNNL
jgi:hypothetical protein